jgi:L-ascorbate metabolism protein UlaG (beta-lactamase superfamily)
MIGFETIGNATAIVFDGKPLLATDPWIAGDAYFGSWATRYAIPAEQRSHILACEYCWISHGHPDHINAASLDVLAGKTLLLPDHEGRRMEKDLRQMGFNVRVLKDREWVQLSPHVKVLSIADYHQDGILLIDVNGRLLVDLNDAVDRGWGGFVRKIIKQYQTSFMLKLFGYGDADMINIRDEAGNRLLPLPPTHDQASRDFWDQFFVEKVTHFARVFGTKYIIPFSVFHRYQRTDSAWAEDFTTPLEKYELLKLPGVEVLPAFIRWDCETDQFEPINPGLSAPELKRPEDFGDDWSQSLDADEKRRLVEYFERIQFLRPHVDQIDFVVGGERIPISMNAAAKTSRRITFEAPRGSLMAAVDYQVFDDLLIGNFMKTTVHGNWGQGLAPHILYEHFTPFIARYADNAGLRTDEELKEYFNRYLKRSPLDFLLHKLEYETVQRVRRYVQPGTGIGRIATRAYSFIKRI